MIIVATLAAITLAVGITRTAHLVRTDGYRQVPTRWR